MSEVQNVSVNGSSEKLWRGETEEPLVTYLRQWLAQFSEGRKPVVPVCRDSDGTLDVQKTLALSIYSEYPCKAMWS